MPDITPPQISALVNHQFEETLLVAPNGMALPVRVWPDLRGAPGPGEQLTSAIVLVLQHSQLMVEQLRRRVMALEVAMAEHARPLAISSHDGLPKPFPNDRPRDDERARLALDAVDEWAALALLASASEPAPAPSSDAEPSDNAPSSALDAITLG